MISLGNPYPHVSTAKLRFADCGRRKVYARPRPMIARPLEVPRRRAPAAIMARAVAASRMPPAALPRAAGPTVLANRATSATVAPLLRAGFAGSGDCGGEKPGEVLTKSAPAATARRAARTF